MKVPAISIVMPIYNAEPFLKQTLTCLLQQTFTDFELICVDDGSTDCTPELLRKFSSKFSHRMHIITQTNAGPGAARNAGIAKVRGKYLALLDADDIYEPNFLERTYQKITADQSDLVVVRSDEYHPDTDQYISTPWTINSHLLPSHIPFAGTDIPQNAFELFVGWPWDKLFRTDFIREQHLRFQNLRSSEDASFCFMSIILAQKISIVDNILVHHRKTPGSVSNTREQTWSCFYDALLDLRRQLKQHHLYRRFERDFINYALNFSLWHLTTLTGSAYFELYDQLKTSWWHELKVDRHSADYFYSPYHYKLYQQVLQNSATDFLFHFLQQKLQEIDHLHQDLEQLRTECQTLEQTLALRNQTIQDLHNSTSWKVGYALTAPARFLKSKFKPST